MKDKLSNELIGNYLKAKEAFDALKQLELSLRMKILEVFEPNEVGTPKTFFEDYVISGSFKLTTNVDEKAFEELRESMSEKELGCFRAKHSIIAANYKKIESDLIDDCLIVKPALPSLSIKKIEEE